MRILHTIDSAGLYGAETMLLALATEQRRRGDTPVLLSLGNEQSGEKLIETEAIRLGFECQRIRMRDGLNLLGGRRIFGIALRLRADVIHSHGYKGNILLAALPRFMRTAPVVTTLHGWTAKSSLSKLGLYRFLDRLLLPRLDAVVAVNPIAVPRCNVHVIANGIVLSERAVPDDPIARQIQDLRRRCGIVVGAVGRLSPEKNFSALLGALSAADANAGVVLLGDGPDMEMLREMISSHGLSGRTLLAGYVSEARSYLPLFDLLVIPSLTEGLPMILLEAMAANLPIIATRVGDIPMTLGELGLLIEPGDAAGLTSALQSMTRDLPQYRARASAGRERVRDQFGAAAMAARYGEIYLAARARTRPSPSSS